MRGRRDGGARASERKRERTAIGSILRSMDRRVALQIAGKQQIWTHEQVRHYSISMQSEISKKHKAFVCENFSHQSEIIAEPFSRCKEGFRIALVERAASDRFRGSLISLVMQQNNVNGLDSPNEDTSSCDIAAP